MDASIEIQQRKYDKIDLETRKRLVKEVIEQQRSLSKTAKRLGIKLSTAKVIIKRYKDEGSFFETKKDKEFRLLKQKQDIAGSGSLELEQRMLTNHNITENNLPCYGELRNFIFPGQMSIFTFTSSPFGVPQPFWISKIY